jgi:hypothetical protein
MYNRLLSTSLAAILLAGVSAQTSVLTAFARPVTSAASARQDGASLYKFNEGGIQFTVPAGWEVKAGDDFVKVFPKNHGAQIAFVALPTPANLDADQRADLFDSLSGKAGINDMTLDKYMDDETLGGMKASLRFYKGKNNGYDVAGMFLLLRGEKPVFITLVAAKSEADAYQELETIINSVRKIE